MEWVAAQVTLLTATVVVTAVAPTWPGPGSLRLGVAAALLVAAVAIGLAALRSLGSAFTPLPRPLPGAPLARGGPYRLVRHPMYTAVLVTALGASAAGSPWALVPTAALALVLDRKAAREEEWLREAHPDYPALCGKVRWRFMPGVR